MATKKARLAWLVEVTERYGQRFIVARVWGFDENGEFVKPGDYAWDPGTEFRDFEVRAYLGQGNRDGAPGEIWGLDHRFAPYDVPDLQRAESMVKVFKRIQRGLDKANSDSGYIKDGDFLTYLTRIGAAIGVREYHVRNHVKRRDMTGTNTSKVDAPELQAWLAHTSDLAVNAPGQLLSSSF